jgi:hypothetical protein
MAFYLAAMLFGTPARRPSWPAFTCERARRPDIWVEAISSILADRRGAEQLGAAGRALAQQQYGLTALAPRLARLIRGLAKS